MRVTDPWFKSAQSLDDTLSTNTEMRGRLHDTRMHVSQEITGRPAKYVMMLCEQLRQLRALRSGIRLSLSSCTCGGGLGQRGVFVDTRLRYLNDSIRTVSKSR